MKNRWVKYLLHIIGWLFLYILPYLFSFPGVPNYKTIFSNPGDNIHLLSFILLIVFCYVNYFYLVPKLYFEKKHIAYFIIVVACYWIVVEMPGMITHRPPIDMPPTHFRDQPRPLLFGKSYTTLLYIISLFASIAIYTRMHLHRLENEKLNAELSFLKAQINPHFLFNTLNSIYSLAIQKDDRAPEAIVQLSELMRYVLKDAKDDMVSLDKEVNYIGNYIALQQSRLGNTVKIIYSAEGNFYSKKIPPLILISFIENAFKHGVNPDETSEINVDIKLAGDILKLIVKNKMVTSVNAEGGIGLQNAQERLSLLYPSNHVLDIKQEDGNYIVDLSITLA